MSSEVLAVVSNVDIDSMHSVEQDNVSCRNGCFTVVEGTTIINPCCDDRHTIQVGPEWVDVSPSNRHGELVEREHLSQDEYVHCLVVRPGNEIGHDVAGLEYCNLTLLPSTDQRHELYSVCISRNVRQVLILDVLDENVWEKVLYLEDRSAWTEPQVKALILLMHAKITPDGLSSVQEDEETKKAEKIAESYCRHVGVERAELSVLHTIDSPRISRVDTERICRQEESKNYKVYEKSTGPETVRRTSQSPRLAGQGEEGVIYEGQGFVLSPEPEKEKSSKRDKSRKSKKSKNNMKETAKIVDEIVTEVVPGHPVPAAVKTPQQRTEDRIRGFIQQRPSAVSAQM